MLYIYMYIYNRLKGNTSIIIIYCVYIQQSPVDNTNEEGVESEAALEGFFVTVSQTLCFCFLLTVSM